MRSQKCKIKGPRNAARMNLAAFMLTRKTVAQPRMELLHGISNHTDGPLDGRPAGDGPAPSPVFR